MPRLGGRMLAGRLRPQGRVDRVERRRRSPSRARAGTRRSGSRAGRWCGRGRSRGRSRSATAGSARAPGTSRAGATRATRGERRGESSSSLVRPLTAQTASWIALSVGGSAVGTGLPSPRPRARRTSGGVIGSLSSEAIASTRVIAPSSTRRLSGTALAISWSTRGSGRSGCESLAIRHRTAIRVRRSGGSSSTRSPQLKRSRSRSASFESASRRPVAGEHDLLAGGVERVEGVDELLLGLLLALEHLDVVDQQRVELAVARLERLRPVAAQRGDELRS